MPFSNITIRTLLFSALIYGGLLPAESPSSEYSVRFENFSETTAFQSAATSDYATQLAASAHSIGLEQTINCSSEMPQRASESSADAVGLASGVLAPGTDNNIEVNLSAHARASGGNFTVCQRRFLIGPVQEINFDSDAIAVSRSIASIPIDFTPTDNNKSFDLAIDAVVHNAYLMQYRLIDSDGTAFSINPATGVAITATEDRTYRLEVELVATAVGSGSNEIERRAEAQIGLRLTPSSGRLPDADTLTPIPEPLISGGVLEPGFPQVVAILFDNQQSCTGTIVGAQTVLSAAHCVFGRQLQLRRLKVVVGPQAIGATDDRHRNIVGFRVPRGEKPGVNYDANIFADDIALLYVDRPFTDITDRPIAPLELFDGSPPLTRLRDDGIELRFIGYGFTNPQNQTRLHFKRWVGMSAVEVSSKTFKNHSSNQRTCKGDSGGPALFVRDDAAAEVVGIVSKGFSPPGETGTGSCKSVGFNTRVDIYRHWIEDFIDQPPSS